MRKSILFSGTKDGAFEVLTGNGSLKDGWTCRIEIFLIVHVELYWWRDNKYFSKNKCVDYRYILSVACAITSVFISLHAPNAHFYVSRWIKVNLTKFVQQLSFKERTGQFHDVFWKDKQSILQKCYEWKLLLQGKALSTFLVKQNIENIQIFKSRAKDRQIFTFSLFFFVLFRY